MKPELKFRAVDGYGEIANAGGRDYAGFALLIAHGDLYAGTGLSPPQVAVWFADGEKVTAPDLDAARTVVRSRYELEK